MPDNSLASLTELRRLLHTARGIEREARHEEAEGYAEAREGRMMEWISGGMPFLRPYPLPPFLSQQDDQPADLSGEVVMESLETVILYMEEQAKKLASQEKQIKELRDEIKKVAKYATDGDDTQDGDDSNENDL
jgi:hypothetical protein